MRTKEKGERRKVAARKRKEKSGAERCIVAYLHSLDPMS